MIQEKRTQTTSQNYSEQINATLAETQTDREMRPSSDSPSLHDMDRANEEFRDFILTCLSPKPTTYKAPSLFLERLKSKLDKL